MLFYGGIHAVYTKDEGFNYQIATHNGWSYRSPEVDLTKGYGCCVGNGCTFGRYAEHPYPAILSSLLSLPVINLGYPHLTPKTVLHSRFLMPLIRRATFAVFQFHWTPETIQDFQVLNPVTATLNFGDQEFGDIQVPMSALQLRQTGQKTIYSKYPTEQEHEAAAHGLSNIIAQRI